MKRVLIFALCAILALGAIGCNAGINEVSATTDDPVVQIGGETLSNTTVTAQVSAIDGGVIAVQLGELAQGEMAAPSSPDENPGSAQGSQPVGTPPQGASGQEGPGGQGGGGMGGTFTADGRTMTISVTDATAIALESMGETRQGTVDDIAVGAVLEVTFGSDGAVISVTVLNLPGGTGGPGGTNGAATASNGTAATTISEDTTVSGTTYTSTGDEENALRIDGAEVTLDGITVEKTGGSTSSAENGDFYGANAGLLAVNGAQVAITGATVNTSARNGNGVFSYGEGTIVNISDSKITTTADNSGGIMTTGGGTTYAKNLTVSTLGNSSAAIRSDRGGGTVAVDGGTYASAGTGSPAIYSTADITVRNATLTASNSEAIVVEGLNSVTLENCDVTGNMASNNNNDGSETIRNIMLYQSMSGDAQVGTSKFTATGGTITAQAGDMFYVTNTHSVISLSGVKLSLANGTLLRVEGNSSSRGWGQAGANGGQLAFAAANMTLAGDVFVDTISTLNFTLGSGAAFTGSISIVANAAGGVAVSDNAVVTVEQGAVWTLTGDCTITSLTNNGAINFNGHTITLADGAVLKG